MKEYAQALKILRKHFGLTQKELAKRLFVSDKTLSKWENGVSQPDISALRDICEVYGITTEQFFAIASGVSVEEVLATPAQPKPTSSKKRWAILLSAIATVLGILGVFIWIFLGNEESEPEFIVPPNHIAITYYIDGEKYGYEIYEKDAYVDYPEPTKHGCVFQGWYTQEEGGLRYEFKRAQASAVLHARFRPIRYTVVFQDPENSSNKYTMSLESGQKWQFPNGFTREGYDFAGWSAKYATYDVGEEGVDLWEYDGCTVYVRALWKLSENVEPSYYTVWFWMTEGSYGGTGMGNGTQKQYGVEWTLPECTAKRKGYTFVCYTRGKKSYKPGDTFLLDLEDNTSSSNGDSVTFRFEWSPNIFYINYESELHEYSYQRAFSYDGNNRIDSSWYGDDLDEYTLIGWEINGKFYEPRQTIGNLTSDDLAEFTAKAIWEFGTSGIYYKLMDDDTYTITDYFSGLSHENVYIPDTHLGKAVTAISAGAFNDGCYIKVFIGNNITSIADRQFKGCTALESITVGENNPAYRDIDGNLYTKDGKTLLQYAVRKTQTSFTLPETVTNIEAEAFDGCSRLTEITIPEGLIVIGAKDFKGCGSLTEIILPESIRVIEAEAFKDCSSLTEINIPKGVTAIGTEAFYGCRGLTKITIPDSVTSIAEDAFRDCSALTSITVSENNPAYRAIDGNLYTKDGKTLLQYAVGKMQTSFTIPEGVTDIGKEAFKGCSSLTEITIPDGVTVIGENAFSDCNNLTSVTCSAFAILHLPRTNLQTATISSGDAIASVTFYGCSKLTKVTLPDGLKSIDGGAFIQCRQLTKIVIPSSVTKIGENAFNGCSSLTEIAIPEGVTVIDRVVFTDCISLTEIVIPESVVSIGGYAFSGCSSLTEIFIPEKVTSIEPTAFDKCLKLMKITVDENNPKYQDIDGNLYTKDGKTLMRYVAGKMQTSFIVPEGVTNVGESAFDSCSNLTEIIISESVTKIGASFWYCRDLTVFIPDSVVSIHAGAFTSTHNVKVYFELRSPPNEWWTYPPAKLYWYSETEPPLNSTGDGYKGNYNYWHYDENGKIVEWIFVEK